MTTTLELEGRPMPPAYKLLSGADVKALPAMEWLVKGILPKRGIAQIYGPSTAGKSFLTFDLCAAIAEGRDWFDYRVRQSPVAYVALEGQGGFANRITAWEIHHERPLPAALRIVMQPFCIASREEIAALGGAVEAAFPRGSVIVIDTQNASVPNADENASADMGAIIEGAKLLADQVQGLVILIAHTGKDPTKGARGHSSQLPAMDASLTVTRDGDIREWRAEKVKDGRESAPHAFRLRVLDLGRDEDGDAITSCAIDPDKNPTQRVRALTRSQRLAVDAYIRACRDGHARFDSNNDMVGLTADDWRDAFYAVCVADTPEAKRKAFQRVRQDLQGSGVLVVNNDLCRIQTPEVCGLESQFFAVSANRDKAGQSGTMSRNVPGQSGTHPFRGVPQCPALGHPATKPANVTQATP